MTQDDMYFFYYGECKTCILVNNFINDTDNRIYFQDILQSIDILDQKETVKKLGIQAVPAIYYQDCLYQGDEAVGMVKRFVEFKQSEQQQALQESLQKQDGPSAFNLANKSQNYSSAVENKSVGIGKGSWEKVQDLNTSIGSMQELDNLPKISEGKIENKAAMYIENRKKQLEEQQRRGQLPKFEQIASQKVSIG